MARIERFEDMEAWQKALEMTKALYQLTSAGEFGRDFGLRDQIRRAAVSIMSNIAEGFERGGDKEFRQFLALSKGSAGEVRSQLYVALHIGYIDQAQFDRLYGQASVIGRLLGGFIKYLRQSSARVKKPGGSL